MIFTTLSVLSIEPLYKSQICTYPCALNRPLLEITKTRSNHERSPNPQRNPQLPNLHNEPIRQLLHVRADVVPFRQGDVEPLHQHRDDRAHLAHREVLARAVRSPDGEGHERGGVCVPLAVSARGEVFLARFGRRLGEFGEPSLRTKFVGEGEEVGGVAVDGVDRGDDRCAFWDEPIRVEMSYFSSK